MNHIEQARQLLASHASLIDTPYRHSARQSIDDWALEHSWGVLTLLVEQEAEITRLRALLPKTADGVSLADCIKLFCPHCGDKVLQYPACCVCENCGTDESGTMELEYCETVSKPKETERGS